jgi:hypothetical protein
MFMQHAEGSRSQQRLPSRPRLVTSTALATGVALLAGSAQGTASAAVVSPPPTPTPPTDGFVTQVAGEAEPDFGAGKVFLGEDEIAAAEACFDGVEGDIAFTVDGVSYDDEDNLFLILRDDENFGVGSDAGSDYVALLDLGLPKIGAFGDSLEGRGIVGVIRLLWGPSNSGDENVVLTCELGGTTLSYVFSFWGRNQVLDFVLNFWYSIPVADSPKPVANPLTLSCSPDPVVVGALVTCEVTRGDPNTEILWRASAKNLPFAGQGVRLDAQGNGTFAFVAPAGALGLPVTVELVEWDRTSVVNVAVPVPSRVPAGEGPAVPVGLLLVAGMAAVAFTLRRRAVNTAG